MRKIIHCDCDCFYAAIEMRDNPALANLPIAVGGSAQRRGVIATCNYAARKFGIHSAMASSAAKRRCEQLVIIAPNMDKYRIASQQIHKIFQQYTPLIEPLSLDEAFLDVSHSQQCQGSATLIAQEIRARVKETVNITISAGIAPNKFLAKIASDWNKPDGQFVITPDLVDEFVLSLPVKKLSGVGKVTAAKMHGMGINTCADLRVMGEEDLNLHFGSYGSRLFQLSHGIDHREVRNDRIRKSLSVEHTYPQDLSSLDACLAELPTLHQELLRRLEKLPSKYVICKQFVKVKFSDFVSTTVETLSQDTNLEIYTGLCEQGFARGGRPVRLLGLGVKLAEKNSLAKTRSEAKRKQTSDGEQLSLCLD
ncbi:MAG: DNA polymerase IV [SAR86 cluster bacterium]|uniref:DNA polymerase IV n=1 Tax=SAR86 cluster bacterium TaxID=2030880 RepID=A0A2A4MGM9_9GAMM|nr:MAG: DNA polymerase IV [SAR86 cluster bacterium]